MLLQGHIVLIIKSYTYNLTELPSLSFVFLSVAFRLRERERERERAMDFNLSSALNKDCKSSFELMKMGTLDGLYHKTSYSLLSHGNCYKTV